MRARQPHLCSLPLALFPGHDAFVSQAESQEQQPYGDDGEPEHHCCRAALPAPGASLLPNYCAEERGCES